MNLNEKCLRGLHPLIRIYTVDDGMVDRVVRWCPECGAIVIDTDCDNRTYPGDVKPMMLSNLYKQIRKQEGYE